MDYHNIFARQQLLDLVDDFREEMRQIEFSEGDSDMDREHKIGLGNALGRAIELTFERVEKLQNKQK